MAYKVARYMQVLEELAPKRLAMEWDNVGLQLGHPDRLVEKAMVTLTITDTLVKEAIRESVDLIIAHHPLIFRPLKHLRTDLPLGKMLSQLMPAGIAVYVAHTNLDVAPQGLNHWLAEFIGLQDTEVLAPREEDPQVGLGRVGYLPPRTLGELSRWLEKKLQATVRVVGELEKMCTKVAVCGGSGGDLISRASFVEADVLITGDISYHDALDALHSGVAVIDAGHFATEAIMVPKVTELLQAALPDVPVLTSLGEGNPFTA